ncbi:hypothetical protein B0H19DRAFT_1299313 [Mycena capillaripes]|nr:hypothetical protein B0H19DRAFT_1299313 [Mycena capillaripes]
MFGGEQGRSSGRTRGYKTLTSPHLTQPPPSANHQFGLYITKAPEIEHMGARYSCPALIMAAGYQNAVNPNPDIGDNGLYTCEYHRVESSHKGYFRAGEAQGSSIADGRRYRPTWSIVPRTETKSRRPTSAGTLESFSSLLIVSLYELNMLKCEPMLGERVEPKGDINELEDALTCLTLTPGAKVVDEMRTKTVEIATTLLVDSQVNIRAGTRHWPPNAICFPS